MRARPWISLITPLCLATLVVAGLLPACGGSSLGNDRTELRDGSMRLTQSPQPTGAGPTERSGWTASAAQGEEPPPSEGSPAVRDPLSTGLKESELPSKGPRSYVWAGGGSEPVGNAPYRKYSVGVEEGLDIDVDAFAAFVDETLADSRSWISDPEREWGFQRVSRGGIKIVIATPATVDRQCLPLTTRGEVSCAKQGYISINLKRWELTVPHWTSTPAAYRRYVINHEMGHYLNQRHVGCPAEGAPAPVMMQQTYRLASRGMEACGTPPEKDCKQCRPNSWPFPEAPLEPATDPSGD